jgi:hypothetical protein
MRPPVITNLYETFSKYHLNEKITGHYCDVCLNDEYNEYLHNKPLSQLTQEDFIGYLCSVDIIDESCNDFKHFLPRLLEIAYESKDPTSYFFDRLWPAIGKTNHHLWPSWEQEALKRFASAYLEKAGGLGNTTDRENAVLDLKEAGLTALE